MKNEQLGPFRALVLAVLVAGLLAALLPAGSVASQAQQSIDDEATVASGAELPPTARSRDRVNAETVCQASTTSEQRACAHASILILDDPRCQRAYDEYSCQFDAALHLALDDASGAQSVPCASARSDAVQASLQLCAQGAENRTSSPEHKVYTFMPWGGTTVVFSGEVCVSVDGQTEPTCEVWRVGVWMAGSGAACGGCGDTGSMAIGLASSYIHPLAPSSQRMGVVGLTDGRGILACGGSEWASAGCTLVRMHHTDPVCHQAPNGSRSCVIEHRFEMTMTGLACTYVRAGEQGPWAHGCSPDDGPKTITTEQTLTYDPDEAKDGWLPVWATACTGLDQEPSHGFGGSRQHCVRWSASWIDVDQA